MTNVQIIILLVIVTILLGALMHFETQLRMEERFSITEFQLRMPIRTLLQKNTLIALASPCYDGTLNRIKECESGGDPNVCNEEFGCGSGQGLYQIIPSTERYCEEKLGRELDMFNPQDNTDCATWLYKNEGVRHWKQSQHCWE